MAFAIVEVILTQSEGIHPLRLPQNSRSEFLGRVMREAQNSKGEISRREMRESERWLI
jgi:hypothetical protein